MQRLAFRIIVAALSIATLSAAEPFRYFDHGGFYRLSKTNDVRHPALVREPREGHFFMRNLYEGAPSPLTLRPLDTNVFLSFQSVTVIAGIPGTNAGVIGFSFANEITALFSKTNIALYTNGDAANVWKSIPFVSDFSKPRTISLALKGETLVVGYEKRRETVALPFVPQSNGIVTLLCGVEGAYFASLSINERRGVLTTDFSGATLHSFGFGSITKDSSGGSPMEP